MKFNAKSNKPTSLGTLLPLILIVVGLFTIPVGLFLVSIGFFILAFRSKKSKSTPTPTPAYDPSPTLVEPIPEPVTEAPKKKIENHRVAGTSFRLDDIKCLLHENAAYTFSKKELIDDGRTNERIYKIGPYYGTAVLEPEPDNPEDPRAIKVLTSGVQIGYIKSGSCAHIHKVLREGRIEKAEIEIAGGSYKILLEDYDSYTDKSTYTLERDTIPFFAVLTLTLKQ